MREAILRSPYLTENVLNARFAGTYGFSVVFTRPHLPEVRARFPAFNAYLDAILDARANAWYLNPLILRERGTVAPHVDRSLRSFTGDREPPNPVRVDVLYVEVPAGMAGGELLLYHDQTLLATIPPVRGTLLRFRGDLRHAVAPVRLVAGDDARVSLVCEQYRLSSDLLTRVPSFLIQSRSPFDAFLDVELARLDAPGYSS
jgi:hypothetical protein